MPKSTNDKVNSVNRLALIVKIEGKEVDDHTMDVVDFMSQVNSFHQIVLKSSQVLFPKGHDFKVNIRPALSEGSIIVDFEIVQTILKKAVNLFNSDPLNALLNFRDTIASSFAVIEAIKRIGRGKITSIEEAKEKTPNGAPISNVHFEINGNNNVVQVITGTEILLKSPDFVTSVKDFTKQLDKPGYDKIELKPTDGSSSGTSIDKNDRSRIVNYVDSSLSINDIVNEFEGYYKIVTLSFDPSYKWRFIASSGAAIAAIVSDQSFIESVSEGNIGIKKDDFWRLKMRSTERVTGNKAHVEFEVIAVLGKSTTPEQGLLPMPEEE